LGAPHAGEHSEAELIRRFAHRIGESQPQLVTFNGDMPVLRYRAMIRDKRPEVEAEGHRDPAAAIFSSEAFPVRPVAADDQAAVFQNQTFRMAA
jgi:hypothetical protein